MSTALPHFSDVQLARERIAGRVARTPVLRDATMDAALGCQAWFKCEMDQPTGAFKLRGATHAIACLRELGNGADVATHSSGNHGAALAYAAREDGRGAHVVMPENSVPAKIDAVRSFGGHVHLCAPNQAAREAGLARLVDEGLIPIPPYDLADIITGQGTAALELLEEVPELDVLITPVGGGGLLAGTALVAESMAPGARVFGAEPTGAADAHASLARGSAVTRWQPETFCDGLRAVVGQMTFAVMQPRVTEILLVSDEETETAMRLVRDQLGRVIEPSSAVAVAAILAHARRFTDQRVGIILTGQNVDFDLFPWLED